ncbi:MULTISPECIES: ThuA domain-containing protein [Mammaliicoccus]|uniref:Trehalose utilization protein ThuA n=1 Tax=Mammaliicoccus vitulinus TaxID=71237 RepID=A0A2T4PWK4_9STAP|nr:MULTISPECIES: ThuA domain-containing protein [Mammaliicoccus]HAL09629.1 trehalose utilization protein ThuA [Staphylococcus sp.]PTI30886.1 trehalose utilization protein ThuA [Mammaliicoccus vitulinus]PTI38590.1 trehalose utilization protein ThuA [Mammaliicoccus vitulinus]PTI72720.1 trehalose utilization protein ThuA [Mammaliicoccus vitulinus]PTI89792.1 trehalose utilization protein ThuA [Mammaliicoccus vitulinus]
MNITVWNEFRHEVESEAIKAVYPDGIHNVIAGFLSKDYKVKTATLDEAEHGLTDEVLAHTDVLIWWGHKAHDEVKDEIVAKVKQRVLDGMGLIVLHSGHFSKIFKSLMGTTCDLKWREADDRERLWVVDPTHPITEGLDSYIELEKEEMYGEHFDIPAPDETVFISWFEGGEIFRSGATFKRGNGKIFYFRPGHESYPTYYNEQIQQVIKNAVEWARNRNTPKHQYGNAQPLEEISEK